MNPFVRRETDGFHAHIRMPRVFFALKHLVFETLPPAFNGETRFACALWSLSKEAKRSNAGKKVPKTR
jgi:hypothetical protein